MKITDQLEAIRAGLATWAQDLGATVALVEGDKDAQDALLGATGLLALLMFNEERMSEADAMAGVTTRAVALIVARPHGWTVTRSVDTTEDTAFGAALYDVLENARNHVSRVVLGGPVEFDPRYTGMQRIDTQGAPFDAFRLNFEVGAGWTDVA